LLLKKLAEFECAKQAAGKRKQQNKKKRSETRPKNIRSNYSFIIKLKYRAHHHTLRNIFFFRIN
jgi:hypothetical protein